MPEFSGEQKRVIEHRDGNLLVSAAAGSGKTTVLVERILHLIRSGEDIASFLIVTFTRAAAEELRQRLTARLETEAETDTRMAQQAERVELASISTIHAFCLQFLTRYFEKAGTEPNLRICTDAERVILQTRALDEALDAAYSDENMLRRLERMGGPEQVRTNIESLYRFLMCQPDPEGWLTEQIERYAQEAGNLDQTQWFQDAAQAEKASLLRVTERARAALQYAQNSMADDCMKMVDFIRAEWKAMEDVALGRADSIKFAVWRSPNKRNEIPSEELNQLREMREAYKADFQEALHGGLRINDWENEKYASMIDAVRALAEITRSFMKEYAVCKHEAGVVDYNDLEQMTLKLTLDAGVCADAKERYHCIFVDEYQDSSAVQETILSRISRGDNVFHVGDVKQSIYGFRQSDPSLFLDEQERFAQGQGGILMALNRNYRSLPNVLYGTNRVFESCMNRESAGMDYDDNARLHPGRAGDETDPAIILQLVNSSTREYVPEDTENESALVYSEIEAVAQLVRSLKGTPVRDRDGNMRPARYGDIVVLRRAVMSVLPQYMEVFENYGIPVYAGKGGSFYETPEISQVMDYLWAVHNPLEDVHLLGALHGIGEFDAQELAEIRLCGRRSEPNGEEMRMWMCLDAYLKQGESDLLREKIARFTEQLHRMRRLAQEESVSTLCSAVLEETGILSRIASLPKGRVRVANLRSLPVRAAEYDAAGLRLGDFLRRIASTAGRNREEDVPAFSENEDVVRIMTVHQSKGLEFPIVIGAGLGEHFRIRNDMSTDGYHISRVWCDRDIGIALEYSDPDEAVNDQTLKTRAIAAVRRKESIAEEMRILYVLMTRARERLVLVGQVSGLKKQLNAWAQGNVDPHRMLDWIVPAVLNHPDAASLRKAYFLDIPERADASRWDIRVRMKTEETEQENQEAVELNDAQTVEEDADLLAQLQYQYPYPEPVVMQKQSVTELAHGKEETFFVRKKPAFLHREKKLSGAERGSALHRFMEILDFDALRSGGDRVQRLTEQAERAVHEDRMTREQADAVIAGIREIEGFLDSAIGRAILDGASILREKPFEIRMDENGLMRLVQGVIDLIVLTGEGAVLVDYKTDHSGLDRESVISRHGAQVRMYRRAAEEAGLHVRACVVYLFVNGVIISIE